MSDCDQNKCQNASLLVLRILEGVFFFTIAASNMIDQLCIKLFCMLERENFELTQKLINLICA